MGLHCTGQDVKLIAQPVRRKRTCGHTLNEWPLVAREKELNDIVNMVDAGRSAFLVGEAGVGKSQLLRAALDGAARPAFVAQVAAAHESTASIFPSLHEWLGLHTDAERGPIILGIDDAHLLHPDAVASLYQLARFDRVVLIITVRPGEPTPEGISKLWLDRLAERVEIKPFTRSAVGEVLGAKLGSYVDVGTVERMQLMTGGNALLLMELVDHTIAEGSLRPVGGIWRWAGCLSYVEGRLVEVVRSRLGDLRPDEAELIYMTALAESLEIDLPVVSELNYAAESLNRRGVMVAEKRGARLNVRLAYPLYRHVVAATMPKLTAYRLRLRLAEAIEQDENDSLDNRPQADTLVTAPHDTASPATIVGLVQARALHYARGLHRADKALTVIDDALKAVPEVAARPLYAYQARFRILDDRCREAATAGEVLLHQENPQSELMQEMVPTVAFAHNALGDSRKALALLDRCHIALPAWKDQSWKFHQLALAQTALLTGRCAEVHAVLDGLRQRLVEDDHSAEYTWFILLRAQLDRHRGRHSEAAKHFRRASRLSIEADWLASQVWVLAQLAGTLAEAGKLTEASRTLSEVRVLQDRASLCPMDVDGADLESAVVFAQAGQRNRAAILAGKVAERCAAAGRLTQALSALHLAARVGHARLVVDRCAQLASLISSAVLQARADHVLALANDDAEALAEIGDRFAQFGMRPLAAEAAAQSCAAYRNAGRLHSARVAAAKCHRLLTSYDIRLPVWTGLGTTPADGSFLGLTPREHEIAGYAATGLSNREIADRLTVSVRTVENHLQRTYHKLGISTRSDLILNLDPRVSSHPSTINSATQR